MRRSQLCPQDIAPQGIAPQALNSHWTLEIINKKSPSEEELFEWYLPDLNWGHTDFQSDALPTELRYLTPLFQKWCKDRSFFIPSKCFKNFVIYYFYNIWCPITMFWFTTFPVYSSNPNYDFKTIFSHNNIIVESN